MIGIELKPELEELIRNISQKNMYSGNKIPESIMRQFEIETTDTSAGILVPYWLSVLEHGRPPRYRTKDHKLYIKIREWMRKHGKLKGQTAEQQDNEAKRLTWYINKYGNKQFNKGNRIFVDIYTAERKKTIEKIDAKFSLAIGKITMEVI